ncbi:MAG: hypothetical protein PHN82_05475 [bacterium]|nr:hypothetical protein [bacterium]
MRALILDDGIRGEIRRVADHARRHPLPLRMLRDIMAGRRRAVGYDPRFVCEIPMGFRVVFSIEEHPGGWMRHISISVGGGNLPHPAAVRQIAGEFGFTGDLGDCERWVEETEDARAVNLVQPLGGEDVTAPADSPSRSTP